MRKELCTCVKTRTKLYLCGRHYREKMDNELKSVHVVGHYNECEDFIKGPISFSTVVHIRNSVLQDSKSMDNALTYLVAEKYSIPVKQVSWQFYDVIK
jgi:hypothetical protein